MCEVCGRGVGRAGRVEWGQAEGVSREGEEKEREGEKKEEEREEG